MLEWGVVKSGDIIQAKGKADEAALLPSEKVEVNGEEISMQAWLNNIFGLSSIQTYFFVVHKESGKSLSQIRKEYMDEEAEG